MRKTIPTMSVVALAAFVFTGGGVVASAEARMVDGPQVTWRLSLCSKRCAFSEGLEQVSAEVSKRAGGKFQIKLYYGEQFSKGKENLDAISVGGIGAALFRAS